MVQFTYRDLVISLPSGVNATVTDEGVLEIRGLSRAAPIRMKPCDDERVISSSCTPSERPLPASGTLHKRARTTAPLGCGSVPLSSVDGGDMDESASCGEAVAPPVYPNGGCSDSDEECGGGEQAHDGCPSDDDEHPAAVTSQGLWNAAKAVLDEGAEKAEVPPPVLPPTASLHAFPFPPEAPLRRWEWRPVETTGPTPPARWAHCAAALGGKMLVYGGEALSAAGADGPPQLSDLHAFDAASGEWRRCQDAPHGRAWHTGTVVRGSLDGSSDIFLVFGGEAARQAARQAGGAKGKAAAGGKPQSLSSMLSYDPEFEAHRAWEGPALAPCEVVSPRLATSSPTPPRSGTRRWTEATGPPPGPATPPACTSKTTPRASSSGAASPTPRAASSSRRGKATAKTRPDPRRDTPPHTAPPDTRRPAPAGRRGESGRRLPATPSRGCRSCTSSPPHIN